MAVWEPWRVVPNVEGTGRACYCLRSQVNDLAVRLAAFDWLAEQVEAHNDILPRQLLAEGFRLQGERVPLLGPQGIFKPKVLPEIPLSITTTTKSPYRDAFAKEGYLSYSYRGTDPNHHENVGLREAWRRRVPLVYFWGLVPGQYLAVWPVFIAGDDPGNLTFTVQVDHIEYSSLDLDSTFAEDPEPRRRYITSVVRQRLHQKSFRARVLRAYRSQCALCRLKHEELLDAAHITPDSEPEGEPVVKNGIALCKLHHAAFDRRFLGIRPDYLIEIRPDLLEESDGPMLRHGLQGLQGKRLIVPRTLGLRPDAGLLAQRFERFRAAI